MFSEQVKQLVPARRIGGQREQAGEVRVHLRGIGMLVALEVGPRGVEGALVGGGERRGLLRLRVVLQFVRVGIERTARRRRIGGRVPGGRRLDVDGVVEHLGLGPLPVHQGLGRECELFLASQPRVRGCRGGALADAALVGIVAAFLVFAAAAAGAGRVAAGGAQAVGERRDVGRGGGGGCGLGVGHGVGRWIGFRGLGSSRPA